MENARTLPHKPLRIWPGVAAVVVMWIAWFFVPEVMPDTGPSPLFVALGCALVVILWWLFFSRAPWIERLGALALMVIGVAITYRLVHESISNGAMGMLLIVFSVPALSLALVAAVAISRGLAVAAGTRRAAIAASIAIACGVFTLIRTGGVSGEGDQDLHWRWTPTPEDRLLAGGDIALVAPAEPVAASSPSSDVPGPAGDPDAQAPGEPSPAVAPPKAPPIAGDTIAPAAPLRAEWPGFRGPQRDSIRRGVRVATDWAKSPPVELWRRPVGPGWSSFAVRGDLVYTQEQRGEHEIVSCYRLSTGEPVWVHSDRTRFWESNAGAGPRATPTVHDGRIYAFGATGIVNALDAERGRRIWSRNAAVDTGNEAPEWGFSSSPLAVGEVVIVAARGRLIAYDAATGSTRWVGETGGSGYSSPHAATIGGVEQVLLLRGAHTVGVAPADGTPLWKHEWPGAGILQPAIPDDGGVLIAGGDMMGGTGLRRIAVANGTGGWSVEERWTSLGLKPYFNDFVVHEGHAYGFDGNILAAIDLADGTRKWKGGRYGHGQLILLADQDVLLVLSEDGELALVKAAPDGFTELARVPAIEGKTWNHPALAGHILLVRNGEEMAAFRLAGPGR